MNNADLLLELGLEEIPAGYIKPAMEKFYSAFKTELAAAGLSFKALDSFSTPRRFAIKVSSLQSQQEDEILERIGPQVDIAYNNDGSLSKAGEGFLRGAKAKEKDIYTIQSDKGEKIAVKITRRGKQTKELLQQFIEHSLGAVNFPKTMRWGDQKMFFARPIRWLLCLFANETIKVRINNIEAGNITYGNRFVSLDTGIVINDISQYESELKKFYVIPRRSERRDRIREIMQEKAENAGLNLIEDDKLVETVTDLVEFPSPVIGEFENQYLELPEKIILSTLGENQKCFGLRGNSGELVNKFIFISNGNPEYGDLIRSGNEKVIAARLADAEFYFKEDTRKPLDHYVQDLKEVLFQKDLGSLWEKTMRIKALSAYLGNFAAAGEEQRGEVIRCAHLCKADLVTLMLGEKEFTKLQGYIGMKYAEKVPEADEVCRGIYEHYFPRSQNDELPDTFCGIIVSLADKMDTVCGIFGAGLIPTGSNDPFALRRSANGIVRIIAEKELEIDLDKFIEESFSLLAEKLPDSEKSEKLVKDFFRQRINWYLKQQNIGYDVADSVMHIGCSNIPDLLKRGKAVERFRRQEDFINLVLGFKRVSNIISDKDNFDEVKNELLIEPAEKSMWQEFLKLEKILDTALLKRDYAGILQKLVQFSKYIDAFFDDVMVNVEDDILRNNRYNLLGQIRQKFLLTADLALVVVEDKKNKKK